MLQAGDVQLTAEKFVAIGFNALALMVQHKWEEVAALNQDERAICKRVAFCHVEHKLSTPTQIEALGEGDDDALEEELEREQECIAKRRRTQDASRE
jgi:hypothetical protein